MTRPNTQHTTHTHTHHGQRRKRTLHSSSQKKGSPLHAIPNHHLPLRKSQRKQHQDTPLYIFICISHQAKHNGYYSKCSMLTAADRYLYKRGGPTLASSLSLTPACISSQDTPHPHPPPQLPFLPLPPNTLKPIYVCSPHTHTHTHTRTHTLPPLLTKSSPYTPYPTPPLSHPPPPMTQTCTACPTTIRNTQPLGDSLQCTPLPTPPCYPLSRSHPHIPTPPLPDQILL